MKLSAREDIPILYMRRAVCHSVPPAVVLCRILYYLRPDVYTISPADICKCRRVASVDYDMGEQVGAFAQPKLGAFRNAPQSQRCVSFSHRIRITIIGFTP